MQAAGAPTIWMMARTRVGLLRLRRAPLLAAAVAFALGELAARQWQAEIAAPLAFALLLLLSLLALRFASRVAPLAVLAMWAAAGCWCAQLQPPAPHSTQLLTYADGLVRTVRGRVVRIRELPPETTAISVADAALSQWQSEPGAWEAERGHARLSVDLAIEQVEDVTPDQSTMRDVAGSARITVMGGAPSLQCGQMLVMPLRLRVPDEYRDPGAWSYAAELESEGITLQASVQARRIEREGAARPTWRCRLYAAQTWASNRLASLATSPVMRHVPAVARLTEADTAMMSAMLFGDRTQLTHNLRLGFERTGSFHLFVVSALHVALLAAMMMWLLRRSRVPEFVVVPLTLAITTAYALFTGFGPPVQRALLMTAVYLIARWMLRETSAAQAAGAAALAVLLLDPRALWTASFQMTFLVIVAISGIAAPMIELTLGAWLRATRDFETTVGSRDYLALRLDPHSAQHRLMLRLFSAATADAFGSWARSIPLLTVRIVLGILRVTIAGAVVEACMTLPMAFYFHRATLFALPANMLLLPLIGVLVPLAVATFALSLCSAWLAALPATITALLLHGMSFVVGRLSHLQLAELRIPGPSMLIVAAALLALTLATLAANNWTERKLSRVSFVAAIVLLLAVPVLTLWPELPLLHAGVLEVTALDVGQGDSLLVVSPQGHTMLVDAGGPVGQPANATRWDIGEEVVAPYLWSRRLRRLDAVLLTHAHSDHMGGMPAVLRDLRPRELWLSIVPGDSPDLHALLDEAAALGIAVRFLHAGQTFEWNDLHANVLAPEIDYANPVEPVNNDSLVMRFNYGKASVLLEGDAEKPSEDQMVREHRVEAVTLLKVGHHGSRTSTNEEFLAAAAPHEAVISVGRRNTFGHPRAEVLARLEQAGTKTWRTDREGAVTFLLKPDGEISAQSVAEQ